MAQHLQAWQSAQSARLRHLTLQLTPSQLEVVEEALSLAGQTKSDENPNARGNAIFEICRRFIEQSGGRK
jgi:ParB family chromosome partitioning protein